MKILSQLIQCLISLDQFLSTLLGLVLVIFGAPIHWADESLSSRAYRMRFYGHWWKAYRLINALFFWQSNHCKEAYESEKNRRHLPPEYRIK